MLTRVHVPISDQHRGVLDGQPVGDRLPDAGGTTGHQRPPPAEPS
jgi:hypothetical protein